MTAKKFTTFSLHYAILLILTLSLIIKSATETDTDTIDSEITTLVNETFCNEAGDLNIVIETQDSNGNKATIKPSKNTVRRTVFNLEVPSNQQELRATFKIIPQNGWYKSNYAIAERVSMFHVIPPPPGKNGTHMILPLDSDSESDDDDDPSVKGNDIGDTGKELDADGLVDISKKGTTEGAAFKFMFPASDNIIKYRFIVYHHTVCSSMERDEFMKQDPEMVNKAMNAAVQKTYSNHYTCSSLRYRGSYRSGYCNTGGYSSSRSYGYGGRYSSSRSYGYGGRYSSSRSYGYGGRYSSSRSYGYGGGYRSSRSYGYGGRRYRKLRKRQSAGATQASDKPIQQRLKWRSRVEHAILDFFAGANFNVLRQRNRVIVFAK